MEILISIEHYRISWKRGSLFKTYVGGQCLENHLLHLHVCWCHSFCPIHKSPFFPHQEASLASLVFLPGQCCQGYDTSTTRCFLALAPESIDLQLSALPIVLPLLSYCASQIHLLINIVLYYNRTVVVQSRSSLSLKTIFTSTQTLELFTMNIKAEIIYKSN